MVAIACNTAASIDWDRFVLSHSHATFAHMQGWQRVISQAYGHPSFFFEAWNGADLVGVLPTTFINSRIFGKQLVSMPYLDSGGPLALNTEIYDKLFHSAVEKASEVGADLCLRSLERDLFSCPCQTSKVTMYLPLKGTPEEMLKVFTSERRNRIKKAVKNGLSVEFRGAEAVDQFYSVFAENMRDLGSPVHSRRFIEEILSEFPEQAGLILVKDSSARTIGAGLYFRFGNVLSLPWVSSLRESFKLNPNILLYWELIKHGCETGADVFDFGRSTVDSGTYEYKRQWGAEPVQLYWYTHSKSGRHALEATDAGSSKNKLMIEMWKKLPLAIANTMGPVLRKSISL